MGSKFVYTLTHGGIQIVSPRRVTQSYTVGIIRNRMGNSIIGSMLEKKYPRCFDTVGRNNVLHSVGTSVQRRIP